MARSTKPASPPAKADRAMSGDAVVDRTARHLRALYWEHYRVASQAITGREATLGDRYMPQWDGDPTGATNRATVSVWHEVARICLQQGLDPEMLVSALFTPIRRPLPTPNVLKSPQFLERAERVLASRAAELRDALELQKQLYSSEIRFLQRAYRSSAAEAGREAITQTGIALSSLFRYCVAARAGDGALAAHFRDGALRHYLFNRSAYDEGWGDFIPRELKQAAMKLRRGVSDATYAE
jgi:hypothetical protein